MNAAKKLKVANALTAVAAVLALAPLYFTHPPFSEYIVYIGGIIIAYLTLFVTSVKQYISSEVSDKAAFMTMLALLVAGGADMLNLFGWSDATLQQARQILAGVAAVISIVSKTLFPSAAQKLKMFNLKNLDK